MDISPRGIDDRFGALRGRRDDGETVVLEVLHFLLVWWVFNLETRFSDTITDPMMKLALLIPLVTALISTCATGVAEIDPVKRATPWDVVALSEAPKMHPSEDRLAKGMKSFFYEGANYKGKPAWFFAYYAAPSGTPPVGGWPAVVCVHGGGGTAYPGWVRAWNNQGFAAIVMDLEGHLPGGGAHGIEGNSPVGVGHESAGPSRKDWFGDRDLPDKEQWFYQAVAAVIRAHSLMASFPEINPKKIGLTGISWGGTIVSTVAGVDNRFAFVVPVYGCGFIQESDNPGLAQWFPPKNMSESQFVDYRKKWDPSAYLSAAKMPMLWVTGVADPVFQIDIFSKSSTSTGGASSLCLRPFLAHGHGNGWEDAPEIYAFAKNIVGDGPALPKIERPDPREAGGIVRAKYTGEFSEAWVYCTSGGGVWKDRKWQFIQCNLDKGELVSRTPLPQGATAFFIYGFRSVGGGRNNHAASELVIIKK